MLAVVQLSFWLAISAAAFAWFVRQERQGRTVTVVLALLWLLIVDSFIYQSQNVVPTGLFHPLIGGLSFRPIDIAIPLALIAHIGVHAGKGRLDLRLLPWVALFAWLTCAAVVGAFLGNSIGLVTFQAKVILYLGTVFLAASVPLSEYLERDRLLNLVRISAGLCLAGLVLDGAGVQLTASLPLLPLANFGILGSDTATIFVTIGLIALAVGLVSDERRLTYLSCAAPLLASALASNQRAAVLGLLVGLLVIGVAFAFASGRMRVTPTELVLTGVALTACLLIPLWIQTTLGDEGPELPLQAELTQEFGGYESVLTDQVRVNQWNSAQELIAERPFFGWGLGKEFTFYEPGHREFQRFNSVHNIGGDLLLRSGFVGLVLFLVAMGVSMIGAFTAWLRERRDVHAAMALALLAGTAGLLAKGMVEDLFEKYRLATLLGLLFGALIAAAAGLEPRSAAAPAAARSARVGLPPDAAGGQGPLGAR